ncbi:MAG TPA: hypothetical protein VKR83_07355, partial [Ktedonobacteraceae bacterium]|nr:hypothetical protein [Ktedonobacteraceae bacterium]
MSKATRISEMAKFHFGNTIFCADGEDGMLADVVFDAPARCMTYIGVKQRRLFGKSAHLPFESVIKAAGDGITLKAKRAELAAAGDAAPGGVSLDSKSIVERVGAAGRGTLKLVATQPESGELAYIVAHNLRAGQNTMLQAEYVTEVAKGQIS